MNNDAVAVLFCFDEDVFSIICFSWFFLIGSIFQDTGWKPSLEFQLIIQESNFSNFKNHCRIPFIKEIKNVFIQIHGNLLLIKTFKHD